MITEMFNGMRWLADLHKLGSEYAAEANNLWPRTGGLHPLRFGLKAPDVSGDWSYIKDAYEFNGRLIGTTQDSIDFVEHPNNDAYDRLYFVDPGENPSDANQGLIKFYDGNAIPDGQALNMLNAHRLGVQNPSFRADGGDFIAPDVRYSSITGEGPEPGRDTFVTHFVYTFVNKWGEESAPSPPTADIIYSRSSTFIGLTYMRNATGDPNIIGMRVYMRISGGYFRVSRAFGDETYESGGYKVENLSDLVRGIDEFEADTSEVIFLVSDAPNEEMVSMSWDRAPQGIKHLILLDNEVMVAARKGQILISELGYIHAFPADTIHRRNIAGEIRGLVKVTGGFVVLTDKRAHLFLGYTAENIVEINIDFPYPLGDKRSLVSVDGNAVWLTSEGIATMGANGGEILSRAFADRDTWGQYIDYQNCQCEIHEQRLIVFCNRPSVNQPKGYVFDLARQEVVSFDCSQATLDGLVYLDPESGEIWFTHDTNGLNRFNRGSYLIGKWRSGRIDVPQGFIPGGCRLQSDKGEESQTLRFDMGIGEDVDGSRLQNVTSDKPFWCGMPWLARWFQFQVEANFPVSHAVIEQDIQDA